MFSIYHILKIKSTDIEKNGQKEENVRKVENVCIKKGGVRRNCLQKRNRGIEKNLRRC